MVQMCDLIVLTTTLAFYADWGQFSDTINVRTINKTEKVYATHGKLYIVIVVFWTLYTYIRRV